MFWHSVFENVFCYNEYRERWLNMKKNLVVLLVFGLLFSLLSVNVQAADPKEFTDVSETHWAYQEINLLSREGAINGYEDGTFRPNNPITRAEAVKVIDLMFTSQAISDYNPNFSDIPTTHWAFDHIARVHDYKYITGYQDNTFRPNNNITRAEMAAILNRVVDLFYEFTQQTRPPHQSSYKDVLESHWAYLHISQLSTVNVIKGYEDNTFRPNNNITRAEFVVMCSNLAYFIFDLYSSN